MPETAYITNYNLERLLHDQFRLSEITVDAEIWSSHRGFINTMFSILEKNHLKALRSILKDSEQFFDSVWLPLAKPEDNYVMLIPPKGPAFHDDPDCPFLHSSYWNVEVPKALQEQGSESVQQFRDWMKKIHGVDLAKSREKDFDSLLRLQYGSLSDPAFAVRVSREFWENFKNPQKALNSDRADLMSMTLGELEEWIEKHLTRARNHWIASPGSAEILNEMVKLSYAPAAERPFHNRTRYSNDQVAAVLSGFHREIKIPLMNALHAYYIACHNPDIALSKRVLRALKFKSCGNCCKNSFKPPTIDGSRKFIESRPF